jgi:hypothetical protein
MKFIIKTFFVSLFAVWLTGCTVDTGSEDFEQDLLVALNPDAGVTTPVRTLGTTYDFNVLVKSHMPQKGVTVTVVYRLDSDNTVAFTQTYTTTTTPLAVTITDIPFNETGTVAVTVTSVARPSNTTTKTFRLVRK